ncbi:TrmH family RNA methyltransferase [Pokkaliibacter sp. CJK22405]|uniref:TrmH family RNA methyltransferase n=1 Tax=Pokkaliibacter sp. CJK22405 TaxID=3384615 RepID=UPI00398525F3
MREITSTQNPQVKAWKKLHTRKGRKQLGCFVLEGEHLVEEALKANIALEALLYLPEVTPPSQMDDDLLVQVSSEVMSAISETQSPQGIAAICRDPQWEEVLPEGNRFLLLDRVQDPGNLGTLIRTADAVGVDAVILGEGCADPYSAKVLRSGQGSHFHLPLIHMAMSTAIEKLKSRNISVFGSALEGGRNFREVPAPEQFGLIMGNEGQGIEAEILSQTDLNLYVPIHGQSESLNVAIAAAILLYHLRG